MVSSGKRYATALLVVGVFTLLNGLLATSMSAERTPFMPGYINTHWITTITIFAAVAHLACTPGHFEGEVLSFVMNIVCLAVCTAAAIADLFNLPLVLKLNWSYPQLEPFYKRDNIYYLIYSFMDFLTSLVAVPLSYKILRTLANSNHNLPRLSPSPQLLGLGTAIVALAVSRLFLYLREVSYTMTSFYSHANYTLDEPAWIFISVATGVICVLSSRGSALYRSATLAAAATLIWPSIFYLWINSRVLQGGHRSGVPRGNVIGTVGVGIAEIAVFVATTLTLINMLPSRSKLRLEPPLRSAFIGLSIVFALLSASAIGLDLYSMAVRSFHRLFYANEQKTPFLAALVAIFTFVSAIPSTSTVAMPICLTIALLTAISTLFQLMAYMYLSVNHYFPTVICEAMLHIENCSDPVTAVGVRIHIVEALINFVTLSLSVLLIGAIMRLSRLRPVRPTFSESEAERADLLERCILWTGVILEVCALSVLAALLTRSDFPEEGHVLVFLYGSIYHLTLVIALIVIPLFQILVAENLHNYPMMSATVLCCSAVRFMEILTQLDYRNMGEPTKATQWRIHQAAEIVALFCHFMTIVFVIRLHAVGETNLLNPMEQLPTEFDNPLRVEEEEGIGYLQLRTEDDI